MGCGNCGDGLYTEDVAAHKGTVPDMESSCGADETELAQSYTIIVIELERREPASRSEQTTAPVSALTGRFAFRPALLPVLERAISKSLVCR